MTWTKHAPRRTGFYLFDGVRRVRDTQQVSLCAPVGIVKIINRGETEMAVEMTGMIRRYPIADFDGEWLPLASVLEREAQP